MRYLKFWFHDYICVHECRSAEIALLLSICTSLVQMTTQIYCMCKGRPILPNSQGKRAMIILLSIVS